MGAEEVGRASGEMRAEWDRARSEVGAAPPSAVRCLSLVGSAGITTVPLSMSITFRLARKWGGQGRAVQGLVAGWTGDGRRSRHTGMLVRPRQ